MICLCAAMTAQQIEASQEITRGEKLSITFIQKHYPEVLTWDDLRMDHLVKVMEELKNEFLDVKKNRESFKTHLERFIGFNLILAKKLADKDFLEQEFNESLEKYQREFGNNKELEKLTFEIFYDFLEALHDNFKKLCITLSQKKNQKVFKIGYAFVEFQTSLLNDTRVRKDLIPDAPELGLMAKAKLALQIKRRLKIR